jgi:hypothetical protein
MPRPLHCVLSMPRTALIWRKSRRIANETGDQAAKRVKRNVKRNEDNLVENEDAEKAGRHKERNVNRLIENDDAEDEVRREAKNLRAKMKLREQVKQQRDAFQSRTAKLLAGLPEDLRRLCL